jgi:hypothetical protein
MLQVPTLRIPNWERLQHYKDRNPIWIKAYVELLLDDEWSDLSDSSKGHLFGIWLLASKYAGKLPFKPKWIARQIGASADIDWLELSQSKFVALNEAASALLANPEHVASPRALARGRDRDREENPLSEVPSDDEKFSTDSVPFRLSLLLLEKIRANDPKFKEPNLQRWADSIDKLIRIDERDPAEIAKVIVWVQAHHFWRSNILSASKLRTQYPQLRLKREEEKAPASRRQIATAPLQVE